jgi:NAD(P)-dependent dehydrogenase (short-subunit alcohol dehydrogenase family)
MAYEAHFRGKVYAISGGASGIGLATAKLLLTYGAKVSIGDINIPSTLPDELSGSLHKDASSTLEDETLFTKVDVQSRSNIDAWISSTVEKFGKLDGAANLAGTIPKDHNIGTIEDIDDDEWEFIMNVNVSGIMRCMRAQLRHMGRGKAPTEAGDDGGINGRGPWSIVNAGSGLSLLGREGTCAYTTSKHAVLGLTRCVAKEVGKRGVRVNCVAPYVLPLPVPLHRPFSIFFTDRK